MPRARKTDPAAEAAHAQMVATIGAMAAAPTPRTKKRADPVPVAGDWPWPLRPYQKAAFDAYEAGMRRQMLIWHRRAGKDMYGLSLARHESQRRVGAYWHFFPKHSQAKRAIWEGVDPRQGRRFIDIAFGDLVARANNTDMLLEFANGSTWQLLGSDNYDRIVGGNAVGVVFSEWALCDPAAWDFLRPIIRENKGWATFITTYRGRNHAWRMVQKLKDNPQWFVDVRTIEQTTDIHGNRIITDEDIAEERREGMDEALIQQEYYCSPVAGLTGSLYARQVRVIQEHPDRRVVLWNPLAPVCCAWNLDNFPVNAALVLFQPGDETRPHKVLDSTTLDFTSLADCIAWIHSHPWAIHTHIISERHRGYLQPLEGLKVFPQVVEPPAQGVVETLTQAWLDQAQIDLEACPVLAESLLGYTRQERRPDAEGVQMFAEGTVYSWHQWQAQAVELAAVWCVDGLTNWTRAPNYKVYDRRRI